MPKKKCFDKKAQQFTDQKKNLKNDQELKFIS